MDWPLGNSQGAPHSPLVPLLPHHPPLHQFTANDIQINGCCQPGRSHGKASCDVWHHLLEPQNLLLRGSKGMLPPLLSAPDPGPHLGFGVPLLLSPGDESPVSRNYWCLQSLAIKSLVRFPTLRAAVEPQSPPPLPSALGKTSRIIRGLWGRMASGCWSDSRLLGPDGGDPAQPSPGRAANETPVYDCVALQSPQLMCADLGE